MGKLGAFLLTKASTKRPDGETLASWYQQEEAKGPPGSFPLLSGFVYDASTLPIMWSEIKGLTETLAWAYIIQQLVTTACSLISHTRRQSWKLQGRGDAGDESRIKKGDDKETRRLERQKIAQNMGWTWRMGGREVSCKGGKKCASLVWKEVLRKRKDEKVVKDNMQAQVDNTQKRGAHQNELVALRQSLNIDI